MASKLLRTLPSLLAIILILSVTHACSDAGSSTVQIDFSDDPEVLTGAQVFIDGEAAGELQPDGALSLSVFTVTAGDHTVELRKEGYEAQPFRVVGAAEGETLTLKAEAATWFTDGQLKNALTLSY